MSFDIFLQGFENGADADRPGTPVRELLLGAASGPPSEDHVHIVHGDGEADVHGLPGQDESLDGLMFNHVSGDAFDLLVTVARTADLVVLAVGCPVCVVSDHQRAHLPPELAEDGVVLVASGADLRTVIEAA